jgi:hypothetical protein
MASQLRGGRTEPGKPTKEVAMKYDLVLRILAVALMLVGAVILVVGDGGVIGFALVAIGLTLTALHTAQSRRHGPTH